MQELARLAGLRESRFRHLFRVEIGLTLTEWRRQARLRRASALLRDYKLSVKEVAAAVGYLYQPNFTRDFKLAFQQTPSNFRKFIAAGGK